MMINKQSKIVFWIMLLIFCMYLQREVIAQNGGGEFVPEVSKFKPVDMTDMVNLFTGDFSYVIPLVMIPSPNASFPLNLSYASGVKANEEASWTGLGWTLNPGAITRTVQNIPDDFDRAVHNFKYDFPDDWDFGITWGKIPLNLNYNTGSQILSGETALGILKLGVDQKGRIELGVKLGNMDINYHEKDMLNVDVLGANISSEGLTVGAIEATRGYSELVSGPMKHLGLQQALRTFAIFFQSQITSKIINSKVSFHFWWTPNRGQDVKTVHGTLYQDLNSDWLKYPWDIRKPSEFLNVLFVAEDDYDKTHFGYNLNQNVVAGAAVDMFSVAAQGLEGSFYPHNEPYQPNAEFRFFGDMGVDSTFAAEDRRDPPGGSTKNTYYRKGIKITAYYKESGTSFRTGKIYSFMITKPDGTRYVFGQPVYAKYMKYTMGSNKYEMRLQEDIVVKENPGEDDVMEHFFKGNLSDDDGYAIAWLLTAILYPDYKPSKKAQEAEAATSEDSKITCNGINEELIPDDGSKGNWIRFNYKKYDNFYLTNATYENTTIGGETFDGKVTGPDGKTVSSHRLAKELYYLVSAETKTHVVLFDLSDNRTDSYESYNYTYNSRDGFNDGESKFRRLDEIMLFQKKDVQRKQDNTFNYSPNKIVRGWKFNYNHELCKGIPNSDNNGNGYIDPDDFADGCVRLGKLTLKSIEQYGKGRRIYTPPYKFDYHKIIAERVDVGPPQMTKIIPRPTTWGKYRYDRWGYFKNNGTKDQHLTNFGNLADQEARLFSLSNITLPTGGEIEIDYESKKYLRVGKYDLEEFNDRKEEIKPIKYVKKIYTKLIPAAGITKASNKWALTKEHYESIFTSDFARSPNDTFIVDIKFEVCGDKNNDNVWWYTKYRWDHSKKANTTWKMRQNSCPKKYHAQISYLAKDHEIIALYPYAHNSSFATEQHANIFEYSVNLIIKPYKTRGADINAANPKCGDGPRVKRLTFKSCFGESVEKTYNYVNWEHNNICSGVASMEPPPLTKDFDDILEPFNDIRTYYSTGPFVCHSHVVVEEKNGAKSRYKFYTPSEKNNEIVYEKDIPDHHRFYETVKTGDYSLSMLSGKDAGVKLNLIRYKVPMVMHDQRSYWGKPISVEYLDKGDVKIASTEYVYKQSFDHEKDQNGNPVLASDRTDYTRSVFLKESNSSAIRENYFVESFGSYRGIHRGVPVYFDYDITTAEQLRGALEGQQIPVGDISKFAPFGGIISNAHVYILGTPKNDPVTAGQYMLKYNALPVVKEVIVKRDNVAQYKKDLMWDGFTGTPLLSEVKSSGLDYKQISKITPAYLKYEGMFKNNMLTQVCQNTVYQNSENRSNAAQSNVLTWKSTNGIWRKHYNYVWKDLLSGNSSVNDMIGYPFEKTDISERWDLWYRVKSLDMYDDYSNPLQITDAVGVKSNFIYGYNSSLLLAETNNASYGECLYTGFEDLPVGKVNFRIEPSSDVYCNNYGAHTGKNCLSISKGTSNDPYYLTNNTPDNPNLGQNGEKKIRWEFWARASTNTTSHTCLQTADANNTWHGATYFNVSTKWRKYTFDATIPSGTVKEYHIVLRPPRSRNGSYIDGTVYYDDVRAYPVDALMKSYTYDPILQKVTSISDYNNIPKHYYYDSFGRLICVKNSEGKMISKVDYHYMADPIEICSYQVNSKDNLFSEMGGGVFYVSDAAPVSTDDESALLMVSEGSEKVKMNLPCESLIELPSRDFNVEFYTKIPQGQKISLKLVWEYTHNEQEKKKRESRSYSVTGCGDWEKVSITIDGETYFPNYSDDDGDALYALIQGVSSNVRFNIDEVRLTEEVHLAGQ